MLAVKIEQNRKREGSVYPAGHRFLQVQQAMKHHSRFLHSQVIFVHDSPSLKRNEREENVKRVADSGKKRTRMEVLLTFSVM